MSTAGLFLYKLAASLFAAGSFEFPLYWPSYWPAGDRASWLMEEPTGFRSRCLLLLLTNSCWSTQWFFFNLLKNPQPRPESRDKNFLREQLTAAKQKPSKTPPVFGFSHFWGRGCCSASYTEGIRKLIQVK